MGGRYQHPVCPSIPRCRHRQLHACRAYDHSCGIFAGVASGRKNFLRRRRIRFDRTNSDQHNAWLAGGLAPALVRGARSGGAPAHGIAIVGARHPSRHFFWTRADLDGMVRARHRAKPRQCATQGKIRIGLPRPIPPCTRCLTISAPTTLKAPSRWANSNVGSNSWVCFCSLQRSISSGVSPVGSICWIFASCSPTHGTIRGLFW